MCTILLLNVPGDGLFQVAGINGDVRRALELLRVAIDVYKDDSDPEKGSTVKVGCPLIICRCCVPNFVGVTLGCFWF